MLITHVRVSEPIGSDVVFNNANRRSLTADNQLSAARLIGNAYCQWKLNPQFQYSTEPPKYNQPCREDVYEHGGATTHRRATHCSS